MAVTTSVKARAPTRVTLRGGPGGRGCGRQLALAVRAYKQDASVFLGNDTNGKKRVKLGVIGGSNLTDSRLFEHLERKLVETKYGEVNIYDSDPADDKQIAFVRRHYAGPGESYVPPHCVQSQAIIKGFKNLGVDRVLLVCSVGSLREGMIPPHSIIFPDDYIALWNTSTYATNDKSGELLPEIDSDGRQSGLQAVRAAGLDKKMHLVGEEAVYVQTRGPRFETKAEIRALAGMGADVVGMTGVSEVVLCNELRLPVTMLCFCDNYANGIKPDGQDAYNEFYANVAANLQTVEDTVGVVIDALLEAEKHGHNGGRPNVLLSR